MATIEQPNGIQNKREQYYILRDLQRILWKHELEVIIAA